MMRWGKWAKRQLFFSVLDYVPPSACLICMTEPVEFETSIPSRLTAGLAVQEKVVEAMERFCYSSRDILAMCLSLEEAMTNAIRHSNKLNELKRVHVACRVDDDRLRVRIQDEGAGFEPDAVPDPTLDEFIERPNGRGLLLMRTYLSLCEYSDGGRCLTMERERNSPLPIVED